MPVDVKQAERRELHFESLEDILADAQTITAGPHRTTGNWSAPQILHHVTFLIDAMNHGSKLSLPLPIRVVGRVLKLLKFHRREMKPGLNPPPAVARRFAPPPDLSLDEALQHMRTQIEFAQKHGMKHPSPMFGKLPHAEAVAMHCRHAELHQSFILPA